METNLIEHDRNLKNDLNLSGMCLKTKLMSFGHSADFYSKFIINILPDGNLL